MKRSALTLLVCAFGISSCGLGGEPPRISTAIQDRIGECGAGLTISSGLKLAIGADIQRGEGSISLSRRSELRAAIFGQVPSHKVADTYTEYLSCITLQSAREEELSAILERKVKFRAWMSERERFTMEDADRMSAFFDREYELRIKGKLLEARDVRIELVNAFMQTAKERGMTMEYIGPFPPMPPMPSPPSPRPLEPLYGEPNRSDYDTDEAYLIDVRHVAASNANTVERNKMVDEQNKAERAAYDRMIAAMTEGTNNSINDHMNRQLNSASDQCVELFGYGDCPIYGRE